jgi:hypothetical protein
MHNPPILLCADLQTEYLFGFCSKFQRGWEGLESGAV